MLGCRERNPVKLWVSVNPGLNKFSECLLVIAAWFVATDPVATKVSQDCADILMLEFYGGVAASILQLQ